MAVLIDTDKVCEILGVNRNYLHQLQHRSKIKWVEKRGRQVFYDEAAILQFKESYKPRR
jgi:predicted site-specific integrase-resolvase